MAVHKDLIRNLILIAAQSYSANLAGRTFLYVTENFHFEVAFKTNAFKHLTGVSSNLSANSFYQKATKHQLTPDQIGFSQTHPYKTAKKKLGCLVDLHRITSELVCVLQDMRTQTVTYHIAISDLDLTIGLVADRLNGVCNSNNWMVPMTLRISDSAVENSAEAEFASFIFSKSAACDKYDRVSYDSQDMALPSRILPMLSDSIVADFQNAGRCIPE